MEKAGIRIEAPCAVAGVTLVPIVKTQLNCWQSKNKLSFFGIKQPLSVVVVAPQAKRSFRVSGEEVSLDQLMEEVPDIKDALEGL